MLLALFATALVLLALLWQLASAPLSRALARRRVAAQAAGDFGHVDPGRELRAEQRARLLLRSCVNQEEWSMYRDLGFLRVWGTVSVGIADGASCAYLLYPHLPIVAYLPKTGVLLGEYCVAFPDHTRPYGSPRLPDSDDVLAKWLALTADERGLIAGANMHLPGRQIAPRKLRQDLARLARWESERDRRYAQASVA
ncbi:MAG TPA: hypothetical protein VGY76_12615 [Solirubrobacteraceae bacterium]|jgi:hypothetical protein|nr:hypothetical protein [Solirubrobacteraceae bacterium]